jgi:hypothetical protein
MGRFDSALAHMDKANTDFENVRVVSDVDYTTSNKDLRVLTEKIHKYRSKLERDSNHARTIIGLIQGIEKVLSPWEQELEKLKRLSEDSELLEQYDNQSSGPLAGRLDRRMPLKAQIVAKVERFIASELKRVQTLREDLDVVVGEWKKHQDKHVLAVQALRRINDSITPV